MPPAPCASLPISWVGATCPRSRAAAFRGPALYRSPSATGRPRRGDRLLPGADRRRVDRARRCAGRRARTPRSRAPLHLCLEPEGRQSASARSRGLSPAHSPHVILNATGFAIGVGERRSRRQSLSRRPMPGAAGQSLPDRAGPPGITSQTGLVCPRPRHERGAARTRRPHHHPRPLVQVRRDMARADPFAHRHLRTRPGPHRLHRRARCQLGEAPAHAAVASNASPSFSPTIPTATAASAMASAMTRRRAPSPSSMRSPETGYRVDGIPQSGNALIERSAVGPDQRRCGERKSPHPPLPGQLLRPVRRSAHCRYAAKSMRAGDNLTTIRSSPATPSICPSASSAMSPSRSSRRAATTSIPRRPITIPLSCRRMAISPSISGCARCSPPHAVIHNGKHGNLEWLPGKATALSAECYPEAALGPLPHALSLHRQRSRRRHAGQAAHGSGDHRSSDPAADPRRDLRTARATSRRWSMNTTSPPAWTGAGTQALRNSHPRSRHDPSRLDLDAGHRRRRERRGAAGNSMPISAISRKPRSATACMSWARSPTGRLETDFLVALARVPRGLGEGGDQSLIRALAADLELRISIRSTATWPRPGLARDPQLWPPSPQVHGAPTATRSNAWNSSRQVLSKRSPFDPARAAITRRPRDHRKHDPARLAKPADPARSTTSSTASTADSSRPVPPAPRPAAASTSCRPGAISTRSTTAPCPRPPPGRSGRNPPRPCSTRHFQDHGAIRKRSVSRPGAPPTCAPAATTSPRRWR